MPGVAVEVVDTAEKAIAAANRTMYRLTSSMLAGDTYKAFELAPRILAGFVAVVWDHNGCTSSGGGRSPNRLWWWHGSHYPRFVRWLVEIDRLVENAGPPTDDPGAPGQ